MRNHKIIIIAKGPIIPGTISAALAKCDKLACRCRRDPKYLHGPYYHSTGWIKGKPTTKTVSREVARQCQRRIENYRKLQNKIETMIADAIDHAPWVQGENK